MDFLKRIADFFEGKEFYKDPLSIEKESQAEPSPLPPVREKENESPPLDGCYQEASGLFRCIDVIRKVKAPRLLDPATPEKVKPILWDGKTPNC